MARSTGEAGQHHDTSLGMERAIPRRDFLQGAAVALVTGGMAAGGAPPGFAAAQTPNAIPAQDRPGYDPPTLTGLRGSHPGSFEAAHALRDGGDLTARAVTLDERYDLVVVGGGISGLSAAHFYRAARPDAKILILDNHDDFGGHAKRNELHLDGRLHLMNGGTLSIESPTPYSPVAEGLLRTLGVDAAALAKTCDKPELYAKFGLRPGVFFDRETFGRDQLVVAPPRPRDGQVASPAAMQAYLAQTPLTPRVQGDILAIETGEVDYLRGLSSDAKKDRLSRISYRDFLLDVAHADPGVVAYYQRRTDGLWGCGVDAVSALDCWASGLPGFAGLRLAPGGTDRMGYTPRGFADTGGSATFHFPDGNASIARLLVRDLIPRAMPGASATDVVTAQADYGRLDRPGQPVRIRLSSTVARACNVRDGVRVTYLRGGQAFAVGARHCVLASWNMMIPYLCPEMPAAQKAALHALVKTPLVYTTVALRDWTAFQRLGVSAIECPGGYHSSIRLNAPVDIGDYRSARDPAAPILVHMVRTPASPGLPEREQHRVGRAELLATSFDTFEREIRAQLGRVLGPGGFDPARDITAITVNRWPHGYAPEYNALIDPDGGLPLAAARARFAAIAIANADCGGGAYTDVAIDQAHRAVSELLA